MAEGIHKTSYRPEKPLLIWDGDCGFCHYWVIKWKKMTGSGFGPTLLSAILAGWLMGLLAWLVAAARETISQIIIIWLTTATIGLAGFHHCIVGNVEVLAGMFVSEFSAADYFSFLGTATLGNAIGGVIFVAILKFSHIAFSEGRR